MTRDYERHQTIFRRNIRLRDGSLLLIRSFSLSDLFSIHRMYSSLSAESKSFFHPIFLQPKLRLSWLLDETLLILSCVSFVRVLLMKIFPRAIYLSLVVLNSQQETVAFTYYKLRKRLAGNGYEAEGGTVVKDDYQGRGLGSELLHHRADFAYAHGIRRVRSWVYADNLKMIRLSQKLKFQKIGLVQRRNPQTGKLYSAWEMILQLDSPKNAVAKQEVTIGE